MIIFAFANYVLLTCKLSILCLLTIYGLKVGCIEFAKPLIYACLLCEVSVFSR